MTMGMRVGGLMLLGYFGWRHFEAALRGERTGIPGP
jgi:hypothetical protein